jgi:hypothetical protein
LKDFAITAIAALFSVLILVNAGGFFVPLAAVFVYAFLTIRLDDTAVMDFLKYAVRFFISTQQYYEWRCPAR